VVMSLHIKYLQNAKNNTLEALAKQGRSRQGINFASGHICQLIAVGVSR